MLIQTLALAHASFSCQTQFTLLGILCKLTAASSVTGHCLSPASRLMASSPQAQLPQAYPILSSATKNIQRPRASVTRACRPRTYPSTLIAHMTGTHMCEQSTTLAHRPSLPEHAHRIHACLLHHPAVPQLCLVGERNVQAPVLVPVARHADAPPDLAS